jgi:hypothetical protein
MKANALVFSKEPALRFYRLPRFFSDPYYRCMVWGGSRFCITTLERIVQMDRDTRQMEIESIARGYIEEVIRDDAGN